MNDEIDLETLEGYYAKAFQQEHHSWKKVEMDKDFSDKYYDAEAMDFKRIIKKYFPEYKDWFDK